MRQKIYQWHYQEHCYIIEWLPHDRFLHNASGPYMVLPHSFHGQWIGQHSRSLVIAYIDYIL